MANDDLAALVARIERLEAMEVARGFFHTYASTLDKPDPGTVTALFVPDAVLVSPQGTSKGHAEIRSFFTTAFANDPSVKRHFVVNLRATTVGPARVRVQAYFLYVGRGDSSVIGWGAYDAQVDVSGDEPLFAELTIDPHLGTDLATGWARTGGAGS